MKNDKVIISLIIVVLITIVSVPSALAYFSTYTQTKGTKTLSFNYDTKLEESIKNKIYKIGIPLSEWDISINFGIKTGFNGAFIINSEVKDNLVAAPR